MEGGTVTVVFTNGAWDMLHFGHLDFLQRARGFGHRLIVGVNSDRSVAELKGPSRPIYGEHDRLAIVRALRCVDDAFLFDSEPELERLLERLRPDVLCKGSDYAGKPITGAQFAGRVELLPLLPGVSTSLAIRRCVHAAMG